MTPTLQETGSQMPETAPLNDSDRVVISGMAGLYPQSRHIKDLDNILYNKINPVSSDALRWKSNHPEVAQYTGNVPDLDRFDAQFFKVHYRLGNTMDSMSRKVLEQTYEAIYDAGLNPEHLSGKKVGVYIGTCFSETEKACFYVASNRSGLGIAGCSKSMFANRISYWLNAKGPSMSIDEACCSSTAALEQAYLAITRGECEAAIVGGAYLCLHPQSSVHFARIMSISMDGKTKSFAQDAAGCARSEAVNVLFLQKAKNALRIYADVIHVKSEFISILDGEAGPRYGFYRNPADTANFLKRFYDEAGIPPNVVEYVEAFGSAVLEADKSELEAIDTVFCKKRDEPLLIGSVMSNIGYGEAASGISAVTKVLLGYHKGELAGNLYCDTPRSDVAALQEGRMRVLTENTNFRGTYTAVNSLSVTGVNAHVLLCGHYKPKVANRYKSNIPHLVTISGRQDSSAAKVLDNLKSHPIDAEELALLHNIHASSISGHLGRGYIILDTKEDQKTVSLSEQVDYYDGVRRPLWFVYSGMGSQWAGMGAQLMRIPIFAAAIERCRKALEPKGIDIVHIITSPDKSIFDNILHSFVGIAAVQIGLTDVLRELGLVPDNIIGHSVGELGCAYADGCLTAEETILASYSRGLVSLETPFIRGSMAAVGVGYQQMSKMCPPEIEIACRNSPDSCTISGPADVMRDFVAELTGKRIFAKEVPCSNIAYHSRYIADAGPGLLKYLKEIIKSPKERSERWVSTSVPQDKWNEPATKYCSAEYHTNNLLKPVLFEETSKLIPSNAVLVEIAPHGLLQAILKRSLAQSCTNIALTRRGHADNVLMLLEAVGKLYMEGYNPKVQVLYPKVEFPVSTGTPYLSHMVDWVHQEEWDLPLYQSADRSIAASCKFIISSHDDEYKYLNGNVIRNKTLVPFSIALVAAWDTLAMSLNVERKSLSLQFQDVHFYAQPILHNQKNVRLDVSLHRGTGWFEILEGNSKVMTGFITPDEKSKDNNTNSVSEELSQDVCELTVQDVYKLLRDREYAYSGEFRSIYYANETLTKAAISWNNNWVTFIDGLLQLNILKHTTSAILQPDFIRKITINVEEHQKYIKINKNGTPVVEAQIAEVHDRTRCGSVTIENIKFREVFPSNDNKITLKSLQFVPRFLDDYDFTTSLHVFLQITAENLNKDTINVTGVKSKIVHSRIFEEIEIIAKENRVPGIQIEYRQIEKDDVDIQKSFENVDLVVVNNLSKNDNIYQTLKLTMKNSTFIVNEKDLIHDAVADHWHSSNYKIVSVLKNEKSHLELALVNSNTPKAINSFTIRSESDLTLLAAARNKMSPHNDLIVLTSYPPFNGLMGLITQWRKDTIKNRVYLIMADEHSNLIQGLTDIVLAYNVCNNGVWGGEYYLPLRETQEMPSNGYKVKLQSTVIGNLDALQWVQAPKRTGTGIPVQVHYSSIHVNDVHKALGVITHKDSTHSNTNHYGLDFSGLTNSGERVMGLVLNGTASSQVLAQPELIWPVPSHWTLEDAATVPFAYVYAFYCLELKACHRIVTKDVTQFRVLVHGAAGALGQAMISIALAMGYKVFATVSDIRKKRFLLRLFPELKAEDIGNSRDPSFKDMVLNATNGKGCNFVICCVKGELKSATLECCAPSGTVFDTVQIPCHDDYKYGMYHLTNERSYMAVDITSILHSPNDEIKKIHAMISDGIARGYVRPLSRVTFAPQEAPRAFRLLAASRHRGRVLLRLRDSLRLTQPKLSCAPSRCHIVLSDTEPLGLQLVDKLINAGAMKLHLHFPVTTPYINYKLRAWKQHEVQVTVSTGDLKDINDINGLIHKAMLLGSIEGVYVAANVSKPNVIKDLDVATRSLCPSLKHFLILGKNHKGHGTCIKRAINGLPTTFLDLSLLESEDADGFIWYRGAIEAAEQALQRSEPILLAHSQRASRISLIQQIAALTDINISNEASVNASLADLGMSLEKSASVNVFLRDTYHISVNEEDISLLTLEKLIEMEEKNKEREFKKLTGLEKFYSFVDPDELLATTEIVYMPTLLYKSSMRDDEFNAKQTYMCIVPGLEGHHERFRTLCELLKLPTFVLQPGLDRPHETPRELAQRYSEVLLKKTGLKRNFYLLGYETGVIMALELAAILEEHGLTGTVICIGDGPKETLAQVEESLQEFTSEEELQTAVARHMFALMAGRAGSNVTSADTVLPDCSSWKQRVEVYVRMLLGRVSHSAQYARGLMEGAYARLMTARHYSVEPRALRSRLVLIRTQRQLADIAPSTLQQFSQRPLEVYDFPAPIEHAVADLRCAAVVNGYLDDKLLEEFKKANLCDTYLMNADTFMSCSAKK